MIDNNPKIKSVTVKIKTDKPVQKTPYQIKGVLMKNFPNEEIVPMLNGAYRKKFLYPRIQVKIHNEEIFLVGINQGVDPILKIQEKIDDLNFGDITFEVLEKSVEEKEDAFFFSSILHKYKFISSWVGLNLNTSKKYTSKSDEDKLQYLNDLIAKNIVFISRETGFELPKNIYSKINVLSLKPTQLDQNGWGAFEGEFYTNLILPNYIGIGNGITRGYGTILGEYSENTPSFDNKEFDELKSKSDDSKFCLDENNFVSSLFEVDISAVQRPNFRKNKNKKNKSYLSKNKKKSNTKSNPNNSKNSKKSKQNTNEPINYNSSEYHKKQHSIR